MLKQRLQGRRQAGHNFRQSAATGLPTQGSDLVDANGKMLGKHDEAKEHKEKGEKY